MLLLTRRGVLVEEAGSSYLADEEGELMPTRTTRARSGRCKPQPALTESPSARVPGCKVFTVQGTMPRDTSLAHPPTQALCADEQGFSLHAAVRCAADDRQALEQLCRTITRPALANERVQINSAGRVVLRLKPPWRDGTTHIAHVATGVQTCALPI